MAQGQVLAQVAAAPSSDALLLAPEEQHQIRECERLVRFRDAVLSGSHPRIKPPHLVTKSAGSPANSSTAPTGPAVPGEGNATNKKSQVEDLLRSDQANDQPAGGRSFASGNLEIDPVLLEKSRDLIRAEIQLKRARIERVLKEQVEQRRAPTKASLQATEPLADFDLADVLSKALALVQSTSATAAQSADDTVANASSSDSFDDNTFYSSQHDTPDLSHSSPRPNDSEDDQMRDSSPYEPVLDPSPVAPAEALRSALAGTSSNSYATSALHQYLPFPAASQPAGLASAFPESSRNTTQNNVKIPGLHAIQQAKAAPEFGTEARLQPSQYPIQGAELRLSMGRPTSQPPSPLIRAHNLSPIAPQPAHVSPLALARQQPIHLQQESQQIVETRRATPPQVAALRKGPSATSSGTSPEGSPQGRRPVERKKSNKKKKRKAERSMVESGRASPLVKAEPSSPSPPNAASYMRPSKRPRQMQRSQDDLSYDEPSYGLPQRNMSDSEYRDHYQRRDYEEIRGPVPYDRLGNPPPTRQVIQQVATSAPRYERQYLDDRQAPPPNAAVRPVSVRPVSPEAYSLEYGQGEAREAHRGDLYARPERYYVDSSTRYNDPRDNHHIDMRPEVDRRRSRSPVTYERPRSVMPPPSRIPPTRVVVDELPRDYVDSAQPVPLVRQSMIPSAHSGDPEIIYERSVPVHSVPNRTDYFRDDGVIYRRASPIYAPQRRVVTQPDVGCHDYRIYREREYSARPGAYPRDGFPPPRSYDQDARLAAEPPRDYAMSRTGSVRPMGDATPYEAGGSIERRGTAMPPRSDFVPRATSLWPADAPRYDVPQGYERRVPDSGDYLRAASARPIDPPRYEPSAEYRPENVWRAEPSAGEYRLPPGVQPEIRREIVHRPGLMPAPRPFSVRPVESGHPVLRQEYRGGSGDVRYERAVYRGGEDVVYVDHRGVGSIDSYGQPPRNNQ
ncbi:hypothetical protein VTK73DRAFT_3424 [Phialemonium thermophilum]|uniref:Uncharacterized protein n=1 Tax=Phialemonium thermophilum TaxID=223376 RepID=A0ABR3WZR9_9PEZI